MWKNCSKPQPSITWYVKHKQKINLLANGAYYKTPISFKPNYIIASFFRLLNQCYFEVLKIIFTRPPWKPNCYGNQVVHNNYYSTLR